MIVNNTTNRHGTTYQYFVCSGRHEKRVDCTQRAVHISDVETKLGREWKRHSLSTEERKQIYEFISSEVREFTANSASERDRLQLRVRQLTGERKRLLQAHLADAVPIDLLREEQARLTRELLRAEQDLARASVTAAKIEQAVLKALEHVENVEERYQSAGPRERRELNQSIFAGFDVFEAAEIQSRPREDYELLLHPDVRQAAARAGSHDDEDPENHKTLTFAGQGCRNDWLVELRRRFLNHRKILARSRR